MKSLLIKPVSGDCNLRCGYCFYREHAIGESRIMAESTVDALLSMMFDSSMEACSFLFQGGEPTLAGLTFFERFVALAREKNRLNVPVLYAMQTNGMHIDEKWADFLNRNNFLVGISLDGTRIVHNAYRKQIDGSGSYDIVERSTRILQNAGVAFSILLTVTDKMTRSAKEVWENCISHGWNNMHIIPCLPDGGIKQALTPSEYGLFLCDLFDCWYASLLGGRYVSIRLFENYVGLLSGGKFELCGLTGRCDAMIVVERDGSCYPCDFFVSPEWKIGDVKSDTIESLRKKARDVFISKNQRSVMARCSSCQYRRICGGGCKGYRDPAGEFYFCSSMRLFFDRCFTRLLLLANQERIIQGKNPLSN